LAVTDAGEVRKSPQAVLDALFSRLAFDPMAFCRMKPADQAETLRRITGLDLRELDRRRQIAYAERTAVNKSVADSAAVVREMPEVEECHEVDVKDLNAQLKAALDHNKAVAVAKLAVDQRKNQIDNVDCEINRIKRDIASLQEKLSHVEGRAANLARELVREYDILRDHVNAEQDTSVIANQLTEADATNRRARQFRERMAAVDRWHANKAHADKLTMQIEDIDEEKKRKLASTKMPVDGLGIDGDTVLFSGVPFSQASTAEQIRTSMAISAADNQGLRTIRIKEGSLLDDFSMGIIADWSEANEYQVLVERVADKAVRSGICISDGLVREVVPAIDDSYA
jgi:uncharacterized membrane-anchored protein YhcB (DUF1043 family)